MLALFLVGVCQFFYFIFAIIAFLALVLFAGLIYFFIDIIKNRKAYVPFVPTPMFVVKEMIKMADVKSGYNIYDLGCGDGRLVIEASKIDNTKCIGVENKFDVVLTANFRKFYKNAKMAIIKRADMYKEDISDADVIFTYLLPIAMDKIEDKIVKECKNGVVVISHGFVFKNLKCLEEKMVGKLIIRKYIK